MKNIFFLLWFLTGMFVNLLQASPVIADDKTENIIFDISFAKAGNGGGIVTFQLKEKVTPRMFQLSGENPRIVFDFYDTGVAAAVKTSIGTNAAAIIKKIRVGSHTVPNRKTRVVFDMADHRYNVTSVYNESTGSYIVRVTRADDIQIIKPTGKKRVVVPEKKKEIQNFADDDIAKPVKESDAVAEQPKRREIWKQQEKGKKNIVPIQTMLLAGKQPVPAADKGNAHKKNKAAKIVEKTAKQTVTPTLAAEKIRKEQVEESGVAKAKQGEQVISEIEPETETAIESFEKEKEKPVINKVSFEKNSENKEMVFFHLNGFFPPMVFAADGKKLQVVCEFFDGTFDGQDQKTIRTMGEYITKVKIKTFDSPGKVRAVLDLSPKYNYDLKQVFFREDNVFVIIISNLGRKK